MISSSIGPRDQLLNLSSCPNLDLSVGHRQIKSEPTMFVVLSYSWLIPRAYTIISFGSDQCYHHVHLTMEFLLKGNPDELLLSPLPTSLSPPWFMLNINLVLETFIGIFFMLAHEVFVWWKEWLPLIHVHLVKVAAVDLRKLVLLPLESSQVSHAYVRSILWSGDLQPSFHTCPEHTKPLIDLFKEKKFLHKS